MKVLHFEQGSVEWMQARAGIPTASEFDSLISSSWKIRTGEMPRTYLAAKLAEAWLGGPLIGFNVFDVEQGRILEEEARPWLELELDAEIRQIGFCTTDDGRVGCSPDGFIGNTGVEIKCPQPTAHVKNILNNAVPAEYLPQIHGGMYVTGFREWVFLSYRRGFPNLLLHVERDEEIQEKIHEALTGFVAQIDAGMERLIEINGGPPKRRAAAPLHEPEPEYQDIIP